MSEMHLNALAGGRIAVVMHHIESGQLSPTPAQKAAFDWLLDQLTDPLAVHRFEDLTQGAYAQLRQASDADLPEQPSDDDAAFWAGAVNVALTMQNPTATARNMRQMAKTFDQAAKDPKSVFKK